MGNIALIRQSWPCLLYTSIVNAFRKATGKEIPYDIVERRPGDIPTCYADSGKAARELGWRAEKTLDDMCADSWRWQMKNPCLLYTSQGDRSRSHSCCSPAPTGWISRQQSYRPHSGSRAGVFHHRAVKAACRCHRPRHSG